jgi:hypothetical protein
MTDYNPIMLVQTKAMSPTESPKNEVYKSEPISVEDILEKLKIDKSDSRNRNLLFIVTTARLGSGENVDVERTIYTLSELEKGKIDSHTPYFWKGTFPLLNAENFDSFLYKGIPKYPPKA